MPTAAQSFLLEGVCRAVAHGAQLASDATTLLSAGRCSSAYVLTVMAREELGRANILWKRALGIKDEEALNEEQVKALGKELTSHLNKLDQGQSTTHFALPPELMAKLTLAHERNDQTALAECNAERRRIAKEARDGDPKRIHFRRMDALYVSLRDGPAWSNPAEIEFIETRNLLLDVACEIGGTLMEAAFDDVIISASARCGIPLPRPTDFDSAVSDRVLLMHPKEVDAINRVARGE